MLSSIHRKLHITEKLKTIIIMKGRQCSSHNHSFNYHIPYKAIEIQGNHCKFKERKKKEECERETERDRETERNLEASEVWYWLSLPDNQKDIIIVNEVANVELKTIKGAVIGDGEEGENVN